MSLNKTIYKTSEWLFFLIILGGAAAFGIYKAIPSNYDTNNYVIFLLILPLVFFGIAFFNKKDNTFGKNYYRIATSISIAFYIIIINYLEKEWCFYLVGVYVVIILIFITVMIKDLLDNNKKDDTFDILFYILAIILLTNNILCIGFMSNDSYLRHQNGGKIGVYINPLSSSSSLYLPKKVDPSLTQDDDVTNKILSILSNASQKETNKNFLDDALNDISIRDNQKNVLKEILKKIIQNNKDINSNENYNLLLSDILSYSVNKKYENRFKNIEQLIKEIKYSFSINDGVIDDIEYGISTDILKLYLHNDEDYTTINFKQGSSDIFNTESDSIKQTSNLIKNLSNYSKLTIILVGHTTKPEVSGIKFSSNYELSEARTSQIKMQLVKEINHDSGVLDVITWHTIPLIHDEKSNINELSVNIYIEPELKRSYEVSDSNSKKPTFLEYMYFTYSLLGTGYGDMFPVSPEAKFLCSIANFLELYFLVIFLNIFFIEISKGSKGSKIRVLVINKKESVNHFDATETKH
jgi:flagellar motor protein MotB